jgi:predicted MFS family arabinose efflux permease
LAPFALEDRRNAAEGRDIAKLELMVPSNGPGAKPADTQAEKSRKVYFSLLIAICAIGDMTYLSMAPFFPQYAEAHGLSPVEIGVIFSSFQWGGLVTTPVAAWLSRRHSSRTLLTACVLIQTLTNLLFSLGPDVPAGPSWFAFALSLRLVHGLVAAVYEVVVSSLIMCSVSRERVGVVIGMQESARGVGLMIGPPIGGVLFGLGGFRVPFLASALAMFLLGIGVWLTVGPEAGTTRHDDESDHPSAGQILMLPHVSVVALLLVAFAMALSVIDPILSPHLEEQFGLTPTQIGFTFASSTVMYALASPVVGLVGNAVGNLRTVLGGIGLVAFSLLLMGPCPWLPVGLRPERLWIIILSLALNGTGASAFTCAAPCMLTACHDAGFSTEAVSDVLSGVLSFTWALGALIGPLYGAALAQASGFGEATTQTAIVLLALAAVSITILQFATEYPAKLGDDEEAPRELSPRSHRRAERVRYFTGALSRLAMRLVPTGWLADSTSRELL